ncbi:ATP-binding protein [Candidatus Beckwithbacteria bacterium]|nr:ATP-binding protein [Candidatus Beckwithbacteria bacterium]
MYISKIQLHNFKGYKGDHEINFDKGVNFFVGDNNCGKSSVFEAIDFIRTKKNRDEVITKTELEEDDFVSIEIEFVGDDLELLVQTEPLKKYQSYLINSNGQKSIRVMRSSEENEITQGKKSKKLSIGNVRIFNPSTSQFENPTGVDNTITALFDAQFVWADTNSGDISDFSKTKICGKIINAITKDFVKSATWENFRKSHKEAFGDGKDSIATTLKPVENKLASIISEQYGETEVKFKFSLPEIESFFKTGNINLSESGIETKSEEKGTGMQRALALALIQVYADISSANSEGESKPILFFIDEPETFLHPQAQNKLLDALEKISSKSQIFIITHSPYLLKKYKKETHSMNVFSRDRGLNKVEPGKEFDLFGISSPTWGEINYYAFGVLTVEFHNELYGFIQAKAIVEDDKNYSEVEFEKYLVSKGFAQDQTYIRLKKDGSTETQTRTLPTRIRNIIHHPENTNNVMFSLDELESSTESLIKLL